MNDLQDAYPLDAQVKDLKGLLDEAQKKIRNVVRHWREFGDMMGIKDDYGLDEIIEDAASVLPEAQG